MTLQEWDQKYREDDGPPKDPAQLVVDTAAEMTPGRALDLGCGSGRNAVWLAERGWEVTAIDGAPAAIALMLERGFRGEAMVADLELHEFRIEPGAWDLIVDHLYLQRDLFEEMRAGLKPGGVALVVALLEEPGKPTHFRVKRGELRGYFRGWDIRHEHEAGGFAEIVARRKE